MKNLFLIVACVLVLSARSYAQNEQAGTGAGSGSGSGAGSGASQTKATTTTTASSSSSKIDEAQTPKFARTFTNVQIELTITDQVGTGVPEKKTVSMVVASGNWGKVRSSGMVRPPADAPVVVDLNVDARPFVLPAMPDGLQLELVLVYSPPGTEKDSRTRPTGINQSLTVGLTSGKPLVISQAADPIGDRKVVVEVKATVLK